MKTARAALPGTPRADGRVSPSEISAIIEAARAEARLAGLHDAEQGATNFTTMMTALEPTQRMVTLAANRIKGDAAARRRLANYLHALVNADGIISKDEVDAVRSVVRSLGEGSVVGE